MEGLGKDFNIVTLADDVWLNLRDYGGVTFIGVNAAGDTWTLSEATAQAGTGAQNLAAIDHSYVQATGVGTETWTKLTQTAAATEVTSAAQDVVAIYVAATSLSDGFDYVKLAATGAGTVFAVLNDLAVQRAPANLPAVSA